MVLVGRMVTIMLNVALFYVFNLRLLACGLYCSVRSFRFHLADSSAYLLKTTEVVDSGGIVSRSREVNCTSWSAMQECPPVCLVAGYSSGFARLAWATATLS